MKTTAPESSAVAVATVEPKNEAVALWRQSTEVAHLCREIVLKCAVDIAGRRYVKVEGWMAIAVGHGCIASIHSVEKVDGEGVKSIAEVRRISDQAILATAEGFVGMDEPDWYGGEVTRFNKRTKKEQTYKVAKRFDHAIRAMAQTRAISRVLRAGFSHVVVLIDEKLSTVPYEEIAGDEGSVLDTSDRDERDEERGAGTAGTPSGDPKSMAEILKGGGTATGATPPVEKKTPEVPRDGEVDLRKQFEGGKWEKVAIHFGKDKDLRLGELPEKKLSWWCDDWSPRPFGDRPIPEIDLLLRAALDVAKLEGFKE